MHSVKSSLVGLTVLIASFSAMADQVMLLNGNRIDGELKEQQEDAITFETEYLGLLTISITHVQKIDLDDPVSILLDSGESLSVRSLNFQEGQLASYVTAAGVEERTDLVKVVGISDQKLADIRDGVWGSEIHHIQAPRPNHRGNPCPGRRG